MCNGLNGTPNLQDRFILGAGMSYVVGQIGGEANHTLTIAEMPSHNHSLVMYMFGTSWSSMDYAIPQFNNSGWGSGSFTTTYAGNSQPHNNMPPYYALAYIMKL
ncbi:hypothetical protein [Anaerospora hongkongensis]|uniref:hypothetical protein n=1 Tax=Anaerospora hongkongensis TaxID=244830 RepID=UPI002FD986A6